MASRQISVLKNIFPSALRKLSWLKIAVDLGSKRVTFDKELVTSRLRCFSGITKTTNFADFLYLGDNSRNIYSRLGTCEIKKTLNFISCKTLRHPKMARRRSRITG
jgi:hypothetical protein